MKKIFLLLAVLIANIAAAQQKPAWQYVDAQTLRIINKGFDNTKRQYARLPAYLQDSVRSTLWERQECSAGLAVRFATNSKRIGVKYELLWNANMVHMAGSGIKGMDLYVWEPNSQNPVPENKWMHLNCIRPYLSKPAEGADSAEAAKKIVERVIVENLDGEMREYMMYLPLYDGVENLWIKVDKGSEITMGDPELVDSDNRIVAYGTSIMQGGCASRPGMNSTNIISRELGCEVINLGFSGEGKMDPCLARAMTEITDVDVFLLDPVPNCTREMCDTLTYDFVKIIREKRPDAKVVMVEGPIYPYAPYDASLRDSLPSKNAAFRANYEKLKAENPENLYYVTSEGLDGVENDGTVDGIHLTDLGYRHYADKLVPILRRVRTPKKK